MLGGPIDPQVRLVGTVAVRLIVPVNLFRAVMVIVDVAETPAVTAAGEVADMLKSWTRNNAVAEWFSEPLVPTTVRV